ncbi:MAG: hypothetical protein ACRDC4_17430 [Plesiomonas sp.]
MLNTPKALRIVGQSVGRSKLWDKLGKWFYNPTTKLQPRARIEFCGKAKNSKTAAQAKREAKKRKNKQ